MSYEKFLEQKNIEFEGVGFTPDSLNKNLFDYQFDITKWSCEKGRSAIFANCGMGKTIMQLAWADAVHKKTGGDVIILAPLGVTFQTIGQGKQFGIEVTQSRDGKITSPITITNYDMLHKFDVSKFQGVVLDESSILKSFDGKTRDLIIDSFSRTPYRLACTATPSPNDYMELGNHAEFLGIMSYTEMLAKFFYHDGGETSKWTLKGHAVNEFWEWVCSWGAMITKPSDLGYSDDGFILPPINYKNIIIKAKNDILGTDSLLEISNGSLNDSRKIKKSTINERVEKAVEIINASDEPWLIWCNLNEEGSLLEKQLLDCVQVSGSDTLENKEDRLLGFSDGKYKKLITKSKIGGFGMNWHHCNNIMYVGINDSYESLYQTVRRCWRFGQKKEVNVYMIYSDMEINIFENLMRKEKNHETMEKAMISRITVKQKSKRTERMRDTYKQDVTNGDGWDMYLGDCVESIQKIDSDSVHYSIFSPPFASLYTYSNSARDMGNCSTNEEFYTHFSFLIKELLRVIMPGRLVSFHCMNLPSTITRDGVIGIKDFRGMLIKLFEDAGFIYHSEVVIWKDPVVAMQRTKALGLLHKQIKKDSAMCRQGIPDYLVTMRKPGKNNEPVKHTGEEFPVDVWQRYASPVWMDINPSNTLQKDSAREEEDEKHICPLQLQVIERALQLWTNPNDLVLSPFAGIGSEGYVSIQQERRFIGFELKESYYKQAVLNLRKASSIKSRSLIGDSLFDDL